MAAVELRLGDRTGSTRLQIPALPSSPNPPFDKLRTCFPQYWANKYTHLQYFRQTAALPPLVPPILGGLRGQCSRLSEALEMGVLSSPILGEACPELVEGGVGG